MRIELGFYPITKQKTYRRCFPFGYSAIGYWSFVIPRSVLLGGSLREQEERYAHQGSDNERS